MKNASVWSFISIVMLTPPVEADSGAILTELSRLESFDFQVSGILISDSYMGQDFRLSIDDLGDLPATIDGGSELMMRVEDNCMSTSGCKVTVIGRFEFELPILLFSIKNAINISSRQEDENPQHDFAACWNVGALSFEQLQYSITIAFEIIDGVPDSNSIRYVSGSRPENELRDLYESARRAVIRCGARRTSLPDGRTELTFDPSRMLLR